MEIKPIEKIQRETEETTCISYRFRSHLYINFLLFPFLFMSFAVICVQRHFLPRDGAIVMFYLQLMHLSFDSM